MQKNTLKLIYTIFLILTVFTTLFALNSCEKHPHPLVKTDKKDATCTENGNIEYWSCAECGKYFSDSKGKNEVTDITIFAAHNYVEGVCSVCGKLKPSIGLNFNLSDDGTYYILTNV